jgi:hypothetical protein
MILAYLRRKEQRGKKFHYLRGKENKKAKGNSEYNRGG